MLIIFALFIIAVVIKSLYRNEERKLKKLAEQHTITPSRTQASIKMPGIANNISLALVELKIKFNYGMHDHETPVFRFGLPLAEMQSDVVVFARPSQNIISVLVDNPVFIPKLKRRAIFEFIGMINYDFNLAKFEMDHEDGSLRLRNILLMTEPDSLSSEKISSWLRNSFEMMDLAFPGFMAIAYGNAVPSEVWAKIKSRVDPRLN